MRICVFCASSNNIRPLFHNACALFGKLLAENGCSLVFGGGDVGLMGTIARAVKENNGQVFGIIPAYLRSGEGRFEDCDDLVLTETLAMRKARMIEEAEGFAVLPGGYGTMDETFEILTLQRHGMLKVPIVFLNTGGFFNSLLDFFARLLSEGFLDHPFSDDAYVTDDPADAVRYLITSRGENIHVF